MGYSTYHHTHGFFCSHAEGITDTVVCDADLYQSGTPASFFKTMLASATTPSDLTERIKTIQATVHGGYAVAFIQDESTYLFRDPVGLKTLFHTETAFASERKAVPFTPHPVLPGEIVQLPGTSLFRYTLDVIPTHTPESLCEAIERSVSMSVKGDAALLFSGGIDSALLAALSDIPVITCGIEGSQDMVFSQKAATLLHKDHIQVPVTSHDIEKALPEVMDILENHALMHIEIGLLMYFICKEWGRTVLISGQGADELFGGYHKYEKAYNQGKPVRELMRKGFDTLSEGLERDGYIAERFGEKIRYPYLDLPVIQRALGIPTHLLFEPQRKAFLRRVADLIGVPPEIVTKPKKAMQYGSGFHNLLKKMNPIM